MIRRLKCIQGYERDNTFCNSIPRAKKQEKDLHHLVRNSRNHWTL